MKFILIISIFLGMLSYGPAYAEDRKPCPPDDRACQIDRNIEDVESTVQDVSEKLRSGDAWKMDETSMGEKPTKTKYGTKALKYPLMVPTYLLRLITLPVGLLGNYLVKEGVAKKVVDLVSNDDRTLWIYPKIELGFGPGFGGGLGITDLNFLDKGYKAYASYLIHISMNQSGRISIGKPDVFYLNERPFAFQFLTDIIHLNDADYYGISAGSQESMRSRYRIDFSRMGGWLGYEPVDDFYIKTNVFFDMSSTEQGSNGPSVETNFPSAELVGFEKVLYYSDFGLSFEHDTRDSDALPEKGGLRRFTFTRHQGMGTTSYDYNEFQLEVIQYLRAWMPRRTLALRMCWTFLDDTGSAGIPFYRLARLDVYSPLRGFSYGRFRDTSSVVFNVEYRFPVWDYIDGQLFVDTGRVFHGVKDFSFKHFKIDGGAGVSLRTKDFFLLRFQIAYGGEGVKFLMKTSQAF